MSPLPSARPVTWNRRKRKEARTSVGRGQCPPAAPAGQGGVWECTRGGPEPATTAMAAGRRAGRGGRPGGSCCGAACGAGPSRCWFTHWLLRRVTELESQEPRGGSNLGRERGQRGGPGHGQCGAPERAPQQSAQRGGVCVAVGTAPGQLAAPSSGALAGSAHAVRPRKQHRKELSSAAARRRPFSRRTVPLFISKTGKVCVGVPQLGKAAPGGGGVRPASRGFRGVGPSTPGSLTRHLSLLQPGPH